MGSFSYFGFQGNIETTGVELKVVFIPLQMFKRLSEVLCELEQQIFFGQIFKGKLFAGRCANGLYLYRLPGLFGVSAAIVVSHFFNNILIKNFKFITMNK